MAGKDFFNRYRFNTVQQLPDIYNYATRTCRELMLLFRVSKLPVTEKYFCYRPSRRRMNCSTNSGSSASPWSRAVEIGCQFQEPGAHCRYDHLEKIFHNPKISGLQYLNTKVTSQAHARWHQIADNKNISVKKRSILKKILQVVWF